ncbi:hypothetical protein [Antarcticirhabdus aurantiaca]|uniref:Uncharacterized protein n=1 Tax=Antarcticirhabdus aurantiaca TaxID=2606717 RepID=A0ACD4NK14_9HYPH|nr:hypothetical protein [Antarcticirhabdus aurantiaca]WAJ27133.1 hypothetical protein OXU80_20085 [Jeongeuplla avenae]
MSQTIQGPPIVLSYAYTLRIAVTGQGGDVLFPDGCELRADVRSYPGARSILAELSTQNGGLVRIDDGTIEVRLTAEQTAAIGHSSVVLDLARTDPNPDVYLYVALKIPVQKPVTRGQA